MFPGYIEYIRLLHSLQAQCFWQLKQAWNMPKTWKRLKVMGSKYVYYLRYYKPLIVGMRNSWFFHLLLPSFPRMLTASTTENQLNQFSHLIFRGKIYTECQLAAGFPFQSVLVSVRHISCLSRPIYPFTPPLIKYVLRDPIRFPTRSGFHLERPARQQYSLTRS